MGSLYRRKKRDPLTGKLVEKGPWWMKYYDQGKPYSHSTQKYEKRGINGSEESRSKGA